MKTKLTVFLCAVLILDLLASVSLALKSQTPPSRTQKLSPLEKAEEDFYTVVDFDSALPADANERTRHQARAKRADMPSRKGVDPSRFAIDEQRESSFGSPPTDTPVEVALPTSQSDAIVIGFVSEAKAFLSNDRTAVISEFTVRVEETLKNNPLTAIKIGDSLLTLRAGGGVRFASGKIIREGQSGKPLPKQGHRYILFLKFNNDEGRDYSILTAYELDAGKVSALDGVNLAGEVQPQYSAYRKYDGADEYGFLQAVRNAITHN